MRKAFLLILTFVGIFSLSSGCAENKLTRQNYDTIVEGSSNKMEVERTLGNKYMARSGNEWEYEDEDRNLSVVIHFDASDKVIAKEWRDASTGTWEGQDPSINPNPPGRKASESGSTTTIKK
ncbi:MAG TPA: hypothetical protein VJZ71_03410 [Phycisphaerae bacterium]|nr:hypothetical protein [Phycisphaerae bacterium]